MKWNSCFKIDLWPQRIFQWIWYTSVIWGWINLWENQISELEESSLYVKEAGEEKLEQPAWFPIFALGERLASSWSWAIHISQNDLKPRKASSQMASHRQVRLEPFRHLISLGFGQTTLRNLSGMEKNPKLSNLCLSVILKLLFSTI